MSLHDLVLLILIIGFSTSSSIRSQSLLIVRLLPESMRSLVDIPDRWKRVHQEFKAEIYLMKGYISPDEKWIFSHEYKYSAKDYDAAAKVIPTTEEKEVPRIENNHMNTREKKRENNDDVQDNIMMPDGFIPQIESRNIITVPTYCPKGERKDSKGRCRTIIS